MKDRPLYSTWQSSTRFEQCSFIAGTLALYCVFSPFFDHECSCSTETGGGLQCIDLR